MRLWRGKVSLWEESRAAYDAYAGGDVVDVGSFHGWYAVLLAPKALPGDTFVLVEPDRDALPTLFRTAASLSATFPEVNFCVVSQAAGDGSSVILEYPYGPEGHPRFASTDDEHAPPSVTVDALVSAFGLAPTFVKVDVEGAETFVIDGMTDTLSHTQTTVMLEVHPLWQPAGVEASQVIQPLETAGYSRRDLDVSEEAIRQMWTPPTA